MATMRSDVQYTVSSLTKFVPGILELLLKLKTYFWDLWLLLYDPVMLPAVLYG